MHRQSLRYFGTLLLFFAAVFGGPTNISLRANPKERSDKDQKRRNKAAAQELGSTYKKWIDEEVPYIITSEERQAFKKFSTDDEREQFIESFWERRNPNPGSPTNEYKEEYYRRIAYSNEHYASGIPGWKSDRGRMYIMYGPPDEIDSHPSGGSYVRPPEEGGGETPAYPFEQWRYRYIEDIGNNVVMEFVDTTMTGEYHLTMDPGEKDAAAHVAGVGLTELEALNGGDKSGRFTNTNGTTLPSGISGGMDEFDRLERFTKLFKPPAVKFDDLRASVTHKLSSNLLPFEVRTDFIRITEDTVLTPITIQVSNRDLEFQAKDGLMHGALDIYGQISSLGGKMASTFSDSLVLEIPEGEFQRLADKKSIYQKALPLRPGRYKLSVVVKDNSNGRIGSDDLSIVVPHYDNDNLSTSSLILADLIQTLPTNRVGAGPFVIGGTKVRPSVNGVFDRSQTLGIFMQVYNLSVDPETHRPSVTIEYDIIKNGKTILSKTEDTEKWTGEMKKVTLEKIMSLQPLPPGEYSVQIKITDNTKKQTVSPTAKFGVR